jgi:hypothetical protein
MGSQYYHRRPFNKILDSRQDSADATIVGDNLCLNVHRDVKVNPHKDALITNLYVLDRSLAQQ